MGIGGYTGKIATRAMNRMNMQYAKSLFLHSTVGKYAAAGAVAGGLYGGFDNRQTSPGVLGGAIRGAILGGAGRGLGMKWSSRMGSKGWGSAAELAKAKAISDSVVTRGAREASVGGIMGMAEGA